MDCRVKGKFRTKRFKFRLTNPICVGDQVEVEKNTIDNTGSIFNLKERKNYIVRRSPQAKKAALLAANIDQILLIVTIRQPKTSYGFINRFLVGAEYYDIPTTIVFNKIDINNNEDNKVLEEMRKVYENCGYKCMSISCERGDNIDKLKNLIEGKVNLFSGHSGVGKSTLLNILMPGLNRATSPISEAWDKGTHTTTFSELIHYNDQTWLIDAPGIREFGIVHIDDARKLDYYFVEIFEYSQHCFYQDCVHDSEPKCAVKKGLLDGKISKSRYSTYLKLLDELKTQKTY